MYLLKNHLNQYYHYNSDGLCYWTTKEKATLLTLTQAHELHGLKFNNNPRIKIRTVSI